MREPIIPCRSGGNYTLRNPLQEPCFVRESTQADAFLKSMMYL
jgi:hypothetical protein